MKAKRLLATLERKPLGYRDARQDIGLPEDEARNYSDLERT